MARLFRCSLSFVGIVVEINLVWILGYSRSRGTGQPFLHWMFLAVLLAGYPSVVATL